MLCKKNIYLLVTFGSDLQPRVKFFNFDICIYFPFHLESIAQLLYIRIYTFLFSDGVIGIKKTKNNYLYPSNSVHLCVCIILNIHFVYIPIEVPFVLVLQFAFETRLVVGCAATTYTNRRPKTCCNLCFTSNLLHKRFASIWG